MLLVCSNVFFLLIGGCRLYTHRWHPEMVRLYALMVLWGLAGMFHHYVFLPPWTLIGEQIPLVASLYVFLVEHEGHRYVDLTGYLTSLSAALLCICGYHCPTFPLVTTHIVYHVVAAFVMDSVYQAFWRYQLQGDSTLLDTYSEEDADELPPLVSPILSSEEEELQSKKHV